MKNLVNWFDQRYKQNKVQALEELAKLCVKAKVWESSNYLVTMSKALDAEDEKPKQYVFRGFEDVQNEVYQYFGVRRDPNLRIIGFPYMVPVKEYICGELKSIGVPDYIELSEQELAVLCSYDIEAFTYYLAGVLLRAMPEEKEQRTKIVQLMCNVLYHGHQYGSLRIYLRESDDKREGCNCNYNVGHKVFKLQSQTVRQRETIIKVSDEDRESVYRFSIWKLSLLLNTGTEVSINTTDLKSAYLSYERYLQQHLMSVNENNEQTAVEGMYYIEDAQSLCTEIEVMLLILNIACHSLDADNEQAKLDLICNTIRWCTLQRGYNVYVNDEINTEKKSPKGFQECISDGKKNFIIRGQYDG